MTDSAAKAPRLTPMKAKFCRLFADLGNATAAARAAGYSSPHVKGSPLLAKDENGDYLDTSIRDELERLRGPRPMVQVVEGETSPGMTTLDDVERSLKQNLLEMALSDTTSDGPRVQATVALLKAIGADVPTQADNKDDEAARKAIAQLLGVKP